MNWLVWNKPVTPSVESDNGASPEEIPSIGVANNGTSPEIQLSDSILEERFVSIDTDIENIGEDIKNIDAEIKHMHADIENIHTELGKLRLNVYSRQDDLENKILIMEKLHLFEQTNTTEQPTTTDNDKINGLIEITKNMIENKFDQLKKLVLKTESQLELMKGSLAKVKESEEQIIPRLKESIMKDVEEKITIQVNALQESIRFEMKQMLEDMNSKIINQPPMIVTLPSQAVKTAIGSSTTPETEKHVQSSTEQKVDQITVEIDLGFNRSVPLTNSYHGLEQSILSILKERSSFETLRSRFEKNVNSGQPNFLVKATNEIVTMDKFNENPSQYLKLKLKKV